MKHTLKRTLYIGAMAIVCLLAVYGYAGAETQLTVVRGAEYVQTEISGAFYDVSLPDESVISLFPDEQFRFPSLFRDARSNDFSGMRVPEGAFECVLYPSRSSALFPVLRLEKGASLALRLWNAQGEIGILNEENPAVVVAQRKTDTESALTAVTRSAFQNRQLSGTCALYASADGKVIFTGSGMDIDAAPSDASVIATVSWTYDASSRKLTASAANADGKSTDIAYNAYVDGVLLMSGKSIGKASGVIKANSDDAAWYLQVVFPDGLVFQTPEYAMDGTVRALASGVSLRTAAEIEAAAASFSTSPTPVPAPPVASTPQPTQAPEKEIILPEYPVPDAANPASVNSRTLAVYRSEGSPAFAVKVENGAFTLMLSDVPSGWTLSCVRLVQRLGSDSTSAAMQNAYSPTAVFAVVNASSTITVTILLTNREGATMKIPAGTYSYQADDQP